MSAKTNSMRTSWK